VILLNVQRAERHLAGSVAMYVCHSPLTWMCNTDVVHDFAATSSTSPVFIDRVQIAARKSNQLSAA
jgi:hypothetical protein